MKGRRIYITGGIAAVAVAVVAVTAALLLSGSDGKSGGDAVNRDAGTTGASQSQAVHESAPGGGTQEGIAVHGHWQIEVKDPDGRLVQRQEFENALTLDGQTKLVQILDRFMGAPAWGILLHTNAPDSGPCDTAFNMLPDDCLIREATAGGGLTSLPNVTQFTTLTVSAPAVSALQLQGTAIATNDGSIDEVKSIICTSLPPSLDPGVCNNGVYFTGKVLSTPVALLTGQQIIVTVTISFS